jgi:3-oxoadipate enol-lactonase
MTDHLLLLHAFPLDASMWEPQISALSGETPIVSPNFPGFGGSPLRGTSVSMDEASDVAASALAAAGADRAVVCGLSMGGYVALAFWRRYRDRVAGLVLANTRAGADDDQAKERRRALAERLRAEGNSFLVDSPPPLLSGRAPAELWGRVRSVIAAQPAEAIAAASLGMAERPDSTEALTRIDVPVLVITSKDDTLIQPGESVSMAGQIPGARLEVIGSAGHLSSLEAADDFNHLLAEHLVRCGGT